ncbi:PREDICTED: peroxidase 44-like [Camelina sativa]|uniref:Peroxidase n=1 Tax=Camelina sativa TaxID=90675 RepID=A0ABM0WP93_CAMSA|nr:PREDICTED: peroxidase 44-like [Camelina sativa]
MRSIPALFVLFCLLVHPTFARRPSERIRLGFYRRSCPRAESIVANVVAKHFRSDNTVTAALVRMQFHDCFVRGCDASLLIDPTPERQSEKSAVPNASVRGYEIIDEAKKLLEAACARTVSCADIVTLATRDSVALAGGPRFLVPTGRRDGLLSNPDDVELPGPAFPVANSIELFAAHGLNTEDMVTLIAGGHSVGVTHCSFIRNRINDPAMNRTLNARLRDICRAPNDPSVFLDQGTPFTVDNVIFREIEAQRGILKIDQNMGLDNSTRETVSTFASNNKIFRRRFAKAMVKMGTIRVLTERLGEIRRNCRVFN